MNNSLSPREYLRTFLEIIKKHSIRNISLPYKDYTKSAIVWETYESDLWSLFEKKDPQSTNDQNMIDLITIGLEKLEDQHSYFYSQYHEDDNSLIFKKEIDPLIGAHINQTAYLMPPREILDSENDQSVQEFIDQLTDKIIELDQKNIDGWIIDLRASYGGGMPFTLCALSPFLPPNTPAGYFLKPDQSPIPWGPYIGISEKQYKLQNPNLPIVVLTGNNTCSAGEAITIAFKGLPNVTIMGQTTYGASTANVIHTLPDGQKIALTSSVMADRNMEVYGAKIQPDINIEGNFDHLFDGTLLSETEFNPKEDKLIWSAKLHITEHKHTQNYTLDP